MVQIVCPSCNFSKEVQREKIPPGVKFATCPRCKRRFELVIDRSSPEDREKRTYTYTAAGPGPSAGTLPPWENRLERGLWQGIYKTFTQVLLSPGSIFRNMNCKAGMKDPLAFGVLFGSIGSMFSFFWQFLRGWGRIDSLAQGALGQIGLSLLFFGVMLFIPIFVLITMFVATAIAHLGLLIAGAGKRGFEGTFRVVAYSQAAQVMGFFPFLGGLVGGLWQLIIQIIGLREIHGTSYLRIFFALFLGLVLVVLLIGATVVPIFILL